MKSKDDGSVERYKTRLVANGMRQIEGSDYTPTFSPVIKANYVRIVLTVAVTNGWPLKQIEISNAFLNGKLNERIIVSQPSGFIDEKFPDHVCLLQKDLYGLKQSHRMWYTRLKDFLVSISFKE